MPKEVSFAADTVFRPEHVADPARAAHRQFSDFDLQYRLRQNADNRLQREVNEYDGFRPSRIILYSMTVLVGLQQLSGISIPFGGSAWKGSPTYPYQGDCFKDGAQYFTEVAALLQKTAPHSWRGDAAHAYTASNSTLVDQVQKMANLDLEMERLVQEHAEIVTKTQLGIGVEQDILIAVYAMMLYLEAEPYTFFQALKVAKAVALASMGTAFGLLGWCLGTSIQTASKVNALGYGEVIAALLPQLTAYQTASSTAPQSRASVGGVRAPGFDDIPEASDAPRAPAAPGPASGAAPQFPWLNAPAGADGSLGEDSTQDDETSDKGTPGTPGSPMPNIAQAMQPMAQAMQPLGQVANVASGLASSANTQGPPRAPKEAVRADDRDDTPEDTGADSATPGSERAPIDAAAAAPEQAPTPAATPNR